jgi:Ca-activated chloride channel family protein
MFQRKSQLLLLLLSTILLFTSSLVAQDDEVIRVDSAIVRLNVGVVDRTGRPVTALDRTNFRIFEDGIEQRILSFEPSAAPFSVVLILDMSGSTLTFRDTIRSSALRFITALDPADRIAVVEFYDKVNLLNDFTTNRDRVLNSIKVANGRGKTQLFRAIDFSLDRLAREGNRRKAIIVLTDGVDSAARDLDRALIEKFRDNDPTQVLRADNEILNRVLSKSDRQGVTIYPLALPTGDPSKLAAPSPIQIALYTTARERLGILAQRTGGEMTTINRLEEMGLLYSQVAANLRALYTIEYQSTNTRRDGKWRTITIETDDPAFISKTRPGYFAR